MARWLENGTRARQDGNGDAWAWCHRVNLDQSVYMLDVDSSSYVDTEHACLEAAGDHTYAEYYPQPIAKEVADFSTYRKTSIISFFERKFSVKDVVDGSGKPIHNKRHVLYYLCDACRRLQVCGPKLFYVVGPSENNEQVRNQTTWQMYEVDYLKDEVIGKYCYREKDEWQIAWTASGLFEVRYRLEKFTGQKINNFNLCL